MSSVGDANLFLICIAVGLGFLNIDLCKFVAVLAFKALAGFWCSG